MTMAPSIPALCVFKASPTFAAGHIFVLGKGWELQSHHSHCLPFTAERLRPAVQRRTPSFGDGARDACGRPDQKISALLHENSLHRQHQKFSLLTQMSGLNQTNYATANHGLTVHSGKHVAPSNSCTPAKKKKTTLLTVALTVSVNISAPSALMPLSGRLHRQTLMCAQLNQWL